MQVPESRQYGVQPAQIEILAPGTFGRRAVDERMRQQGGQQLRVGRAQSGEPALGVVGLSEVPCSPSVQQHIAGTDIPAARVGAQQRHIRHAAQVQHRTAAAGSAEGRLVKRRCQRRALPPGRNVGATKIRHRRNAGTHRNQCAIADLQAVRCRSIRVVANRLPVTADGAHGMGGNPRRVQQTQRTVREALSQIVMQLQGQAEVSFARALQRIELVTQVVRERGAVGGADARLSVGRKLGQNAVDGVLAGAAHEADVELGGRRVDHCAWAGSVCATRRVASASSFATQPEVWVRK